MTKFKVAVDAGHGGFGVTPGKRTPDGEYEWDFNNKVAKACVSKLKANGVEVIRTDDPTGKTDVGLTSRTNKANNAKADVMISFHHNANKGIWGTHTGTETFTYIGNWPDAERLAREVQNRIVKAYGLRDRGLKKANFAIVRQSEMPAILVEGGYMDSTIDIKKLRNDAVLEAAGIAAAEGILAYLGTSSSKGASKPTSKPAQESPAPSSSTPAKGYVNGSAGQRVESIYKGKEGLNFYTKAYFDSKYKAGTFGYGMGWEIVKRVKVGSAYMFEVKNSKGVKYYVTASAEYVKVEGKAKASSTSSKGSSSTANIKVGSTVTLQDHASKYQTGEKIPSSVKGKKYTVMQIKNVNQSRSKKAYLLKEIMSWVLEQDVFPKTTAKKSSGGGSAIVPYPGHLIKIGSRGKDVQRIQHAVGVATDGIFGKATKSAVMAYQRRHGLGVDGIVGKETWDKMF
ncbi:N-acetylmuramoyl-L-alanine amidase [Terribacillus sp. 7520-G]|uniref:N-acetylmuramoyl-L-alanine amidase n=1 Tax=Terribacillus sp. 7520-G TaxID=2025389 RepID=UPI000BA73DAF|nr:N-acetylmuramoyl-L-alanine amidase [Terribacillus sp. 7520-G]PAD39831.1 hypothetical protein CHH53_04105 [Terribacillus sp. 7520-G]